MLPIIFSMLSRKITVNYVGLLMKTMPTLPWYFSKSDGSFAKNGQILFWYGLNIDEASKLIKEFDSSSIGSSLSSSKESGVFTSAQQKRGFHHSTVRRNTNPNPPLSEGKQTERKKLL